MYHRKEKYFGKKRILTDHVGHIIKSCRFSCKEFRSLHSALREDLSGVSGVCEGDDFIAACEHDIMLADDGTAAHSLDPDLLRISCDTLGGTVIFIVVGIVKTLIDSVCKSDGCSARRVDLTVVVLLQDLDIKSCCRKDRGNLFSRLHEKIDPDGHICRAKDCVHFARLFYMV